MGGTGGNSISYELSLGYWTYLLLAAVYGLIITVIVPYFAQRSWWLSLEKEENVTRFVTVMVEGWTRLGEALQTQVLEMMNLPTNQKGPSMNQIKEMEMMAQAPWVVMLDQIGMGQLRKTLVRYPMLEPYAKNTAITIATRLKENPQMKETAEQFLTLLGAEQ